MRVRGNSSLMSGSVHCFYFPVEIILTHLQNNLGQRSALGLSLFLLPSE